MNAERRIQRIRAAVPPPGAARADWQILGEVAQALGYEASFPFASAHAIWDEIRRVWPAAAGITYARLDEGGLQWPCPDATHPGTPILHGDGFPSGPRATLKCLNHYPSSELTDAEYPFLLITGRTLYAFNAATMTARTPNVQLRPTDTLDMAPADAQRLGLKDGQRVGLRSRYGRAELPLRLLDAIKPGELFATFHDPAVQLNAVTSPQRDRFVHTPEYKRTAVVVEACA
jgi:formate dehydrogenase major subunit